MKLTPPAYWGLGLLAQRGAGEAHSISSSRLSRSVSIGFQNIHCMPPLPASLTLDLR